MNQKYYLLGDAARVLGIKPYQLSYLLTTRQIPEPTRIGGRRAFTAVELAVVAKLLKQQLAREIELRGGHHDK